MGGAPKSLKSYNPESAVEFGCNYGKNLLLLNGLKYRSGLDMSKSAVEEAVNKYGLNVTESTKEKLPFILCHDMVMMTCSVLNHMPNLDNIINNLEEIALKAVVLAETNDKIDWNYSPHDYESYDFASWIMNGSR